MVNMKKSGRMEKNLAKEVMTDDRKVVEKHRHISRSTRSRFPCLKSVWQNHTG